MGFFRDYVKKQTGYIRPDVARSWKSKLSMVYALIAWNTLGFTVYCFAKESFPKTSNNSYDYAKILGVKDATVKKYNLFEKVDEYKLELTQEEIDNYLKSSKEN